MLNPHDAPPGTVAVEHEDCDGCMYDDPEGAGACGQAEDAWVFCDGECRKDGCSVIYKPIDPVIPYDAALAALAESHVRFSALRDALRQAIADREVLAARVERTEKERDCLQEHFDGAREALGKQLSGLFEGTISEGIDLICFSCAEAEKLVSEKNDALTQTAKELKHVQFLLAHLTANFDRMEKENTRLTALLREIHQAADDLCNGAPGTDEIFYHETRDRIASEVKL